jgi:ribose 5-phosphate isomerase B
MIIGIGADHRGYLLKSFIIDYLRKRYTVKDYGTDSDASVDYPHFALNVARDVANKKLRFGILLCYSGQGMVMTANKVRGVRAAVCIDPTIARLSRAHNNANILVLPAGFMKPGRKVRAIIDTFLKTPFEGGRHLRRLNIIKNYENQRHKKSV